MEQLEDKTQGWLLLLLFPPLLTSEFPRGPWLTQGSEAVPIPTGRSHALCQWKGRGICLKQSAPPGRTTAAPARSSIACVRSNLKTWVLKCSTVDPGPPLLTRTSHQELCLSALQWHKHVYAVIKPFRRGQAAEETLKCRGIGSGLCMLCYVTWRQWNTEQLSQSMRRTICANLEKLLGYITTEKFNLKNSKSLCRVYTVS